MHTTKPAVEAELLAYIPALHHFARRFYKSRYDSDDLVQDTLIKAFPISTGPKKGHALKAGCSPSCATRITRVMPKVAASMSVSATR
ncbi:sigma factor [Neorhizobium alkalisoli]|uniref:sigma factor n=1 Tax=Neorhizobium alkalisoli TaxID=528178 RepID=UPI0032B20D26